MWWNAVGVCAGGDVCVCVLEAMWCVLRRAGLLELVPKWQKGPHSCSPSTRMTPRAGPSRRSRSSREYSHNDAPPITPLPIIPATTASSTPARCSLVLLPTPPAPGDVPVRAYCTGVLVGPTKDAAQSKYTATTTTRITTHVALVAIYVLHTYAYKIPSTTG